MTFPADYDTLTRVTADDYLDTAGKEGDVILDQIQDAIEATQAAIGKTGETAAGTVEARLAATPAAIAAAVVAHEVAGDPHGQYTTAAEVASLAPAETTATSGTLIADATAKTTPADGDSVGLSDSAASSVLKRLSWANLKAALQSVFATLAGVVGGQTLNGGTAASETLTLRSTAHATKGKILFGTSAYDEVNNRLGIGTVSPAAPVDVTGNIYCNNQLRLNNNSGSVSAQSGNQVLYFNDSLKETRLVSMYSSGAFVSICAGSSIVERARVDATGMGIGCTPSARLHSLSTSEQLRLGYDAATYAACTVNAAGELKIAAPLAWRPPASYTPVVNGDLTVEATSNTSLTFRLKGTDGTVRSASLTLA